MTNKKSTKKTQRITIFLYKCINNYDRRSSAEWGGGVDPKSYEIRKRGRDGSTPRIWTAWILIKNKSHYSIHFCTLFFLRVLCKYLFSMNTCFWENVCKSNYYQFWQNRPETENRISEHITKARDPLLIRFLHSLFIAEIQKTLGSADSAIKLWPY